MADSPGIFSQGLSEDALSCNEQGHQTCLDCAMRMKQKPEACSSCNLIVQSRQVWCFCSLGLRESSLNPFENIAGLSAT